MCTNLGYPPPRLSLLLTLIFRSTRGNVLRNAWLPMRLLIELLRPSNFYDGDWYVSISSRFWSESGARHALQGCMQRSSKHHVSK